MLKALIIFVMLLSLAPVIQGQDDGFPLCSAAELAVVADLATGYDDLVASLSSDGDTSLEKTLAYTEAQIEWREQLWDQMPPCVEALEVAVLMSQNSSDLGAMAALTYSGISLSLNRYKDRLFFEGNNRERLANKFEEISALIESGDRPAEPAAGERSLEYCDEAQTETLVAALRENEDLIMQAAAIRSPGQLLDYIQVKLDWRDQVWDKLPPCTKSIGVGRQMTQTASDLATAVMFSFAQVPGTANPFAGRLQDDLTLLGQLLSYHVVRSNEGDKLQAVEELAEELETALPACSDADLAVVVERLVSFDGLIEQAYNIKSTDDLLAYSAELIEWRREHWSKLPFCAEAVGISLIATNAANDLTAYHALGLSGESTDLTLFRDAVFRGLTKVDVWSAGKGAIDDGSAATPQEDSLPACTESEKPFLLAIREQAQFFAYLVSEFESVDDVVNFGEVQILWRDQIWKKFPPCQEAIKAAQLLIQSTGDTVPAAALLFFIRVPEEENPFLGEMSDARERLEAYSTIFGSE